VPDDLAAIVDRALEKDPGRRFPDAEAMHAALLGEDVPAATARLAPVPGEAMAQDRTEVLGDEAGTRAEAPARTLPAVLGVLVVALVPGLGLWGLTRWLGTEELVTDAEPIDTEEGTTAESPAEEATGDEPDAADDAGDDPAQAPADEVDDEADPDEGTPPDPTTLEELIAVLVAAPPETYGEKHDDLLDDLVELSREDDPEDRTEDARALQEDVEQWIDAGELDGGIGGITLAILDGVAAG
jgi:hypothetical protein